MKHRGGIHSGPEPETSGKGFFVVGAKAALNNPNSGGWLRGAKPTPVRTNKAYSSQRAEIRHDIQ